MAATTDPAPTVYDQVPYELMAFPQMHIGSLAAIGRLFGLRPADPRHCRVLELACGLGGNLLAMAESFPDSQFLGFDLSNRQITTGYKLAHAVGLSNLCLETADIMALDFGEERFDFILCHGAFSWISPTVQKCVFALCQKHLSPEGIAYISYNTQPGWRIRSVLRDLMRFHANARSDPKERVAQGFAILQFLAENLADTDPLLQAFVNHHLEALRRYPSTYVFHEFFGEVHLPAYFHEFIAQAQQYGLRYLGEATPSITSVYASTTDAVAALQGPSTDIVRSEQYNDFLAGRSFRQTLLCHADCPVRTSPDPQVFFRLYATLSLRLEAETNDKAYFVTASGLHATTSNPFAKVLLQTLARVGSFPVYMPAVLRQIRYRHASLERPDMDTFGKIGALLGRLLFCGGGAVYAAVPHLARRPSRRPRASQLARIMAGRGLKVFTPLNRSVTLDVFTQHLIQHLDGTNDRPDLVALLLDDYHSGRFNAISEDRKLLEPHMMQQLISEGVDRSLDQLAALHLLVA